MTRQSHCAEQQEPHEKKHFKIWQKTAETYFTASGRSDHNPSMNRSVRNLSGITEVTFRVLRLSFQILPGIAAAKKSDIWTSPNFAPATKI